MAANLAHKKAGSLQLLMVLGNTRHRKALPWHGCNDVWQHGWLQLWPVVAGHRHPKLAPGSSRGRPRRQPSRCNLPSHPPKPAQRLQRGARVRRCGSSLLGSWHAGEGRAAAHKTGETRDASVERGRRRRQPPNPGNSRQLGGLPKHLKLHPIHPRISLGSGHLRISLRWQKTQMCLCFVGIVLAGKCSLINILADKQTP